MAAARVLRACAFDRMELIFQSEKIKSGVAAFFVREINLSLTFARGKRIKKVKQKQVKR